MKLSKKQASGSLGTLAKGAFTSDHFYKMSKKIAQLTKVVAYLHSKQDDHSTVLASTKESYEHEIYLVIRDAKFRISALDTTNIALADKFVIAMQVCYWSEPFDYKEKDLLIASKDDEILSLQSESQSAESVHQTTVQSLSSSITDLTSVINEKSATILDSNVRNIAQVHSLTSEIQRYQVEREKYIEKISASHSKELDQIKSCLASDELRLTLEVKSKDEALRSSISNYTRQLETANHKVDTILSRLIKFELQNAESQLIIEEFRKEMTTLRIVHEEELSKIKYQHDSGVVEKESILEEWQAKQRTLHNEVEEKDLELSKAKEMLTSKKSQISQLASDLEKVSNCLQENNIELSALKNLATNAEHTVQQLTKKLHDVEYEFRKSAIGSEEDLSVATEKIKTSDETNVALQSQLCSLRNSKVAVDSEFAALTQRHKALSNDLADRSRNVPFFEMQQERFELELKAFTGKEIMKQNENSNLSSSNGELTKQLEQTKIGLLKLESESIKNEKQLKEDLNTAHRKVTTLKEELSKTKTDSEALKVELEMMHKEDESLRMLIEKQDLSIIRMSDEFKIEKKILLDNQTSQETMHLMKIDRLNISWESKMIDTVMLADNRRATELSEAKLTRQFQKDKEHVSSQHIAAVSMLQGLNENTQKRLSVTASESIESAGRIESLIEHELFLLSKTHADSIHYAISQTIAERDNHYNSIIQQNDSSMNVKFSVHEMNVQAMKNEHDRITSANESSLTANHANVIEEMTLMHELQIEMCRNEFASSVADLKADYKGQMEVMMNEYKEGIDRLLTEKLALGLAKDTDIAELKITIGDQMVAAYDLRQKIEGYEDDILNLNTLITTRDEDLVNLREEMLEIMKQKEAVIEKTHLQSIDKLHKVHLHEIRNMLKEFDQAQRFLKAQIQEQLVSLEAAALKYINREPREIDLKRMSDLESVLIRAEDHTELLQSELDGMKLELNNREKSYNQMFGSNPVVGIMNPVGKPGQKKISVDRKLPPIPKQVKGLFTNQIRPDSSK